MAAVFSLQTLIPTWLSSTLLISGPALAQGRSDIAGDLCLRAKATDTGTCTAPKASPHLQFGVAPISAGGEVKTLVAR